jgi:signal transduction histidine kinase
VVERWLRLEDALLRPIGSASRRQARALVRASAGLAPWGAAFAAIFAWLGLDALAASLALASVGVAAAPLVQWITRSVPTAVHWANAFLLQSLVVAGFFVGGTLAACLPWIVFCVAAAVFLAGPVAGAVWTAIGALSMVGLLVAQLQGLLPPSAVPPEVEWGLATLAHIGLFVVVLVVASAVTAVDDRARAELEVARAAADEANSAKSTFLARMSHELRTPMNAVIGYAELLLEDADGTMVEDLERIRSAGRHLLGLVNDILDLSKIDAGHLTFAREVVDVRALAEDVMATAAPLLAARRNRGAVEATGAVVVVADALRVRQCLLNLVSNAARFTDDGSVTVRAERHGDEVWTSVIDTGRGIAPQHLGRIFEPFVQATDDVAHERGGTGLGLALVRQFATGMGGRVWVESELGRGSTFVVALPAAPGR